MASTRTDDVTIAANLTIVIREDDEIPEFRTEKEHVEHLAREHVNKQFNDPRGHFTASVDKEEEFETKNVWVAVCNVMN